MQCEYGLRLGVQLLFCLLCFLLHLWVSDHAAAYLAGRVKQCLGKTGVCRIPVWLGVSAGGGWDRREKAFSEDFCVIALLDEGLLLRPSMKQLSKVILACAHIFIWGEPGLHMDLGEWVGVLRVNENRWLEFKVL